MVEESDCLAIGLVMGGIYVFITWCVAVAASSWLTRIMHQSSWNDKYQKITDEENFDEVNDLFRSWSVPPFIDAIVTTSNLVNCPDSHPEDLIWDQWPGSYIHCDCLESPNRRYYKLHQQCDREQSEDYQGPDDSPLCYDVGPFDPVLQNRFNGVRYCGVRSDISFKQMVRPVKNVDNGSQACPDGYQPCNPEFLSEQGSLLDYVICYKEGEKELTCPITDLQFKS